MIQAETAFYQGLFGDQLVRKPQFMNPEPQPLIGSGSGSCRLLFIADAGINAEISADDLQLMRKITDWEALKLRPEEVWVLNLKGRHVLFTRIRELWNVPNMICFGIAPERLGLSVSGNENMTFRFRETNFLFTRSLKELRSDRVAKEHFFRAALLPMFSQAVSGK